MKTFSILLTSGLWLLASVCSAADLTLTDGRVLKEAKITSQSATSVTVRHAGGLASVPKAQLPADLQAKYLVSASSAPSAVQPDSAKAARIAKARADEQARIAKAKADQSERAAALETEAKEQLHEVEYLVESHREPITLDYNLPTDRKNERVNASMDTWSKKISMQHGSIARLDGSIGGTSFADATLIIKVDGAEVRRATIRGGERVEMAWNLYGTEQPEIVKVDTTKPIPQEQRQNSMRVVYKDPGFTATRD